MFKLSFAHIKQSKNVVPYLKIEMYGKKGSWKTTSALESEQPILLIDREKGSSTYGIAYDFDPYEVDPRNVKEVMELGEMLYTLNQQLNQINLQRSSLGEEQWQKSLQQLVEYFSTQYQLPEHTHESFLNGKFYWKTIIVDSGTWIYNDLVESYRQLFGKGSETFRLEPKDYQPIKKEWYKFLDNLIALPCHIIVTAHRTENRKARMENGKMNYMAIDTENPWKADLEKKNEHVFDNIIYMDYDETTQNHWAVIEKSRIVDKDKNPILPPRIDNVDSRTFVPYLLSLVQGGKGRKLETRGNSNVARLDNRFENLLDKVNENIVTLRWSSDYAMERFMESTGYGTLDELRKDSESIQKLNKLYDLTLSYLNSTQENDDIV